MSPSDLATVREPTADPTDASRRLSELLRAVVDAGGSDLHLTVGASPSMRVHGALEQFPGWPPLSADDTEQLVRSMLTTAAWARFADERELDFAHTVPGVGRFRVNLYRQRGAAGAALRVVPARVPTLEDLGLPPAVAAFAQLRRGLVLVTGPTGSGKSTTLAALVDLVNRTRAGHVVTIEDPIEYLHEHRRCVVNQREVGSDTADFAVALRHALRQDPDVIMVGELRDLEATSVAVTAAETGHLVLATLHTRSAAQTVDRLVDVFPADRQQQVRTQLAGCLEGIVAQALVPTPDGGGRTAVTEVLVATPAIRNLVREGKVHQITAALQSGAQHGMVTFDQHLAQRYRDGLVSRESALELAHSPDELRLGRS